jgi:hypothetical protein
MQCFALLEDFTFILTLFSVGYLIRALQSNPALTLQRLIKVKLN